MSESLRDQIARLIYDVHNDPFVDSEACADAVLPLVEAEVERRTAALTAERDEWHQAYESADDREKVAVMRAEAAEARVTELERALREVLATANITWPLAFDDALDAARAVLAAAAPTEDES